MHFLWPGMQMCHEGHKRCGQALAMHDAVKVHSCVSTADRVSCSSSVHYLLLTLVMLQAEFSILDFKATEEPTKVQLPLYIELKGKRIDNGCGTLTVCCLALVRALFHTHTL